MYVQGVLFLKTDPGKKGYAIGQEIKTLVVERYSSSVWRGKSI